MQHELTALGLRHRSGDAHLAAELIGLMCLALRDALDLRRVDGVDSSALISFVP
jgi:hypothetical protein